MSRDSQAKAYQENASAYDADNGQRQRTMAQKVRFVAGLIADSPDDCSKAILEVGCGTGLFTAGMAETLPRAAITATDAFAAMIDRARPRLARFTNVRLTQYDAEASFHEAGAFDVVCGCDIIHHVDDPVNALRHWRKTVRPGGRLAFFETNAWNPPLYLRNFRRPEEARFKYSTRRNLMRWLGEAGWVAPEVTHAPLYLPNGPRSWWPMIGAAETMLHAIAPLRLVSGGLLLTARAP